MTERGEHTPGIVAQRDLAWGRNAVAFIRERGLETEFNDWCGGWPCPVEAASPDLISELVEALEDCASGLEYVRHRHGELEGVGFDRALGRARAAAAKARGGAA